MVSERFPAKLVLCSEGHYPVCIPVVRTAWITLAAGAAAAAASVAVWAYAPISLRRFLAHVVPHRTKCFQLLIEMEFQNEDDVESFKQIWADLAQYVAKYEPQTLSYELVEADSVKHKLLVFERYTTKAALTDVHQKSEAYSTFKVKFEELNVQVSKKGQSYYESSLGYM